MGSFPECAHLLLLHHLLASVQAPLDLLLLQYSPVVEFFLNHLFLFQHWLELTLALEACQMALEVCHWNCSNFSESFSAHYQDSSQISFHIFHLLGSNFWFSPCTLVSHQSQAETSLHQLHFSPLYIWFRAPATARSNSSQPANVMARESVTMMTMVAREN